MLSNKLDIISKQLIEKSAFIATQELLGTYETVLNCINTTTYKIIFINISI